MIQNKKMKILVVDDEASIRMLLLRVLAGQERTVLVAEGGRKAIELFAESGRTLRFSTCTCRI
jgi:CheY-like chemotaxis protein